jgi:HEAT repeat protein
VRRAAKNALNALDPQWRSSAAARDAFAGFVNALSDADDRIRDRALEALELVKDLGVQPLLLNRLLDGRDDSPKVALDTLDRLFPGWMAQNESASRLLRAFVEGDDGGRRRLLPCVVAILKQSPENCDLDLLVRLLQKSYQTRQKEVWDAAVQAFGRVGQVKPDRLTSLLSDHADPVIREQAAAGSERLIGHDPTLVGILLTVLRNCQEDVLVRCAAARALGRVGDPQAFPALIGTFEQAANVLKEVVLEALGCLKDRRALSCICDALARRDYYPLQIAAARALGRIGDPTAMRHLKSVLCDKTHAVLVRRSIYLELKRLDPDQARDCGDELDRQQYELDTRHPEKKVPQMLREWNSRRDPNRSVHTTVAEQASTKALLLDLGYDLDQFLSQLYDFPVAQQLATAWGVGGYWRRR